VHVIPDGHGSAHDGENAALQKAAIVVVGHDVVVTIVPPKLVVVGPVVVVTVTTTGAHSRPVLRKKIGRVPN
jgi:hypothetical protein